MSFKPRRFLAIFYARNKEFYRDLGTLGWTFLFPLLVIIAFSYIFDLDADQLFKGGYVGDNKPAGGDLIGWVQVSSVEEGLDKLSHHGIEVLVDPTAQPQKYWINETSPKAKIVERLLLSDPQGAVLPGVFERGVIATRQIKYVDWLFPGMITMNVMWMALWGVGWVIVRQRKLGILKRYKASPLTAFEYILAQVLSRLVILVLTGLMVFWGSHLIYPFATLGSYWDLLIVYTAGCFSLSSVGMVIAARMTSEEFASGILNLISFPMMFLSEIWFSLEGSADWVRMLAKLMPLWHMTDGMRRIMTQGATLWEVKDSMFVLVATSLIFMLIGSFSFKWTKS